MISIVREESDDKGLVLTKSQQDKWDYIVNKKGTEYLLTALAHAFRRNDRLGFDKLLQNLFMALVKDYNAGQRMADARAEDEAPAAEVEVAEDAPEHAPQAGDACNATNGKATPPIA